MNPSPENESAALREEIDATRRRMDDTVDALGDRLRGRHLLDEILGFFRSDSGNGDSDGSDKLARAKEQVSRSAENAARAVVDTVKANPLPALVIGAGIAWMIYEARRDKSVRPDIEDELEDTDDSGVDYDPDTHYDRPMEYPSGMRAEAEGQGKFAEMKDALADKTERVKDKLSDATDTAREKLGSLKERAGDKLQAAKERASEISSQMKEGAQRAYAKTRDTVTTTVNEHPLEIGLACLAAGVIAGLAIPTPRPVHRMAGPAADRLRQRARESGREMLEKGKRVARAAADAAKQEAQNQGLTPSGLRDKAGAIAEQAGQAGAEAARDEGLAPEGGHENSGSQSDNPSLARPGM